MSAIISYWRPISSAPLDGTPIITDVGVVFCGYDDDWRYCDLYGRGDGSKPFTIPAVWMPVPELPVGVPDPVAGERAAQLAGAAQELLDVLTTVVTMDPYNYLGVRAWGRALRAADKRARALIEKLKTP